MPASPGESLRAAIAEGDLEALRLILTEEKVNVNEVWKQVRVGGLWLGRVLEAG